ELVATARRRDARAARRVHGGCGNPGTESGHTGGLRVEYQVVHRAGLARDLAHHEGAAHVRSVSVDGSTEIDEHEVALGDHPVRWAVMRERPVRAARHDGRERRFLGSETPHGRIEKLAELLLRRL